MNYITVDLGGTNLRIARINSNLIIEDILKYETEVELGIEQIMKKIINAINQLQNNETIGVGIGVPGQIDCMKKKIMNANNLRIKDYRIGDILKKATGLEVYLQNDANIAGLGEAVVGSGKEYDNVYYVTWSTGIGGSLIIDGKIINGKNMCTGEIGNLIIKPGGIKHGLMNEGGLEGISSGTYLKNKAIEIGYENVGDLMELYKNHNKDVIDLINEVTDAMARGLANILHVVEVDCFIFGGGVSIKSGDILIPLILKKINNYLLPVMQDTVIIKKSKLGDDAGLFGAAIIVQNEKKKEKTNK